MSFNGFSNSARPPKPSAANPTNPPTTPASTFSRGVHLPIRHEHIRIARRARAVGFAPSSDASSAGRPGGFAFEMSIFIFAGMINSTLERKS